MINLLSPEIKKARKYAQYNTVLVQYLVIITIAIAGMTALMVYGQLTLNTTKGNLEELISEDNIKAAALDPINTEAEELATTVDVIGTLLEQEVKFSYVLQEIGSIIPPGVTLSAISLSQDTTKPITLQVNLLTPEKAGVLQQNLIESDLFETADILGVNQGNVAGYPYIGQVQAYFNPDVPLNSLDDPEPTVNAEETVEPAAEELPVDESANEDNTEEDAGAETDPQEEETQ